MILTNEHLNLGMSSNGAWSYAQLRKLGASEFIKGPRLLKGWKDWLIGRDVPYEDIREFIALKDKHLTKVRNIKTLGLFDKVYKKNAERKEKKVIVLEEPAYNYWDHHGQQHFKYARRKRNRY